LQGNGRARQGQGQGQGETRQGRAVIFIIEHIKKTRIFLKKKKMNKKNEDIKNKDRKN